jgi:S1-C subfamily serine protease
VATNAHVVAGVQNPVLLDQGRRIRAKVVLFDERLDFAVLRTESDLAGSPLQLADEASKKGDSVAVIGYPGGGPLRISPGVIFRSQLALGRDIYEDGVVTREIYALEANVIPGNSGGPAVRPDGKVAGIIFGSSANRQGVGYALTAKAIKKDLEEAKQKTSSVSSGPCIQSE